MIDENSTLEDVCFEVSSALERHSITGVLTGGSAATIYVPDVYTSYDADFVLTSYPERERLELALAEIGYVRSVVGGTVSSANPEKTTSPMRTLFGWFSTNA